jgi:hypothetical protein
MLGMKSRHRYADKDNDLPSSMTSVGAFRNSLIETDKFSFAWPNRAGTHSNGNAAGINVSSKIKMVFIDYSKV